MPYRIDQAGDVFDVFENAREANAYGADIWMGHWDAQGQFVADAICWRAVKREAKRKD